MEPRLATGAILTNLEKKVRGIALFRLGNQLEQLDPQFLKLLKKSPV